MHWSGEAFHVCKASRPGHPLIFMAERRPALPGSLGSLVCTLIDGLSVWSNYPRPGWKVGDFVNGSHDGA